MHLKNLHILFLLLLAGSLHAQFNEKSFGKDTVTNKDLAWYQNELSKSEKKAAKNEIVDALVNLGNFSMQQHDYPNAIQSFKRAIGLYEELNNHSGMGDMMIKICDAYRTQSDFPRLLEYLQEALKEYKKAGNENAQAKTLRSIGYYYLNVSYDRRPAIPWFQQSLAMYRKLGNQLEEANLIGDLGATYNLCKDSLLALTYLQQALSLAQKIDYKLGLAKWYGTLGDYYFRIPVDIPKAMDCFKKAIDLWQEIDNKIGYAGVMINLADVYVYAPETALKNAGIPPSEKFDLAIESVKKGYLIFKELLPSSELMWPLGIIWETYEKMGKFDSAFVYHRLFVSIRDSVTGTDKQKDIVRLEEKYLYEKKTDSLRMQEQLMDAQLQKQSLLNRQQKQELELNQSQLALVNNEKMLQQADFLKSQSDLENERLIKQQKEKEIQLQTVRVKSLTQQNEIIQLNQQRQWIYIISVFILLGAGSMYFIYRSRLRGVKLEAQLIKEKAFQEKKDSEFQQKLADISMSALRSQMNPHFIFNCLNSIKLYTTQNDTAAASAYLTKFSKLIRLVLDNSRNERISLSSELAALELYIEMEAMRFKEKLSYSFQIEKNVETNYIEIPPLLLQPYVENAIWHGLMPKEEGGQIEINVKMQDESLLEINITDNGIGRTAAAAIRNKTNKKHNSYAMKATTERIALINQIYKTGASVSVHDLVDANGQAAGTQVNIQIPV
jgi:tetratricopeptide (TPR) repeat protein